MFLLRHVTSLAAILVCSFLVSPAQSSSDAALLKLLTAKQSQDHSQDAALSPASSSSSSSQSSLSSYLNDYNAAFPSPLSASDELWLESAAGSNPLLMRDEEEEAEEEEEGKNGLLSVASKRFHPSAFFGSRGKRVLAHLTGGEGFGKRFYDSAFVGHRGKRTRIGEEEDEEEQGLGKSMSKRFNPMGFVGSRGKRYLPGLEALFLTQMYKKLDAEKWKRQSLLGFHAARG